MAALTKLERGLLAGVFVLTVLAGLGRYTSMPAVPAFVLATGALAGLAWVVSFATEQLGEHFGPAVTGMLQSTLGNLPEFFVVLFALSAGETVVAQTSILGSIFANALLVLGIVIVVGARKGAGTMRFGRRLPNDTATLLLLSTFIIVIVGLSLASEDHASDDIRTISALSAVVLLAVYLTWAIPYVRSGGGEDPSHRAPVRVSLALSAVLLAVAGVGAAFVSEWFVHALQPTIDAVGMSEAFAGLVVVAIAGNAVENATGVVLAAKGEAELAISVVKNSVSQIAAFLFPALVLVSLLFSPPLTFAVAPVYIGALLLTALAVWQITGDGEATAFEGWALIATYVMLATLTLFE